MYCYQALHPYNPSALLQIWSAVTVSVATDTGLPPSVELVLLENGTLPSPLGPHGSTLILSPFRESCMEVRAIGPTSSPHPDTYSLMVRHKTKLRYLALMAIGLILFFGAPSASRFVRHHPLFNWLLVSQITFTHPSPLPLYFFQEPCCLLLIQCCSRSDAVTVVAPLHLLQDDPKGGCGLGCGRARGVLAACKGVTGDTLLKHYHV